MIEDYNYLINTIKEFFNQNNFDKAIEFAEKAISLNSSIGDAYFWAGLSKYFNNDFSEAASELEFYLHTIRNDKLNTSLNSQQKFIAYYTLAVISAKSNELDMTRYCLKNCLNEFNELPKVPFQLMQSSALIWNELIKEDKNYSDKNTNENILFHYGLNEILTEFDDEMLWKEVVNRHWKELKDSEFETNDILFGIFNVKNWESSWIRTNSIDIEKWIIKPDEDSKLHPILLDKTPYYKKHKILEINRPSHNEKIAYVVWNKNEWKWIKDENGFWISTKEPDVEVWS